VVCLAPRALEDSLRPRRLVGASVRPLNFTVRRRVAVTLGLAPPLVSALQAATCNP
jgi:hypothetical protein